MYASFTKKILNYLFGVENPIAVSESFVQAKNKEEKNNVVVYIVPGKRWFARVIGRNGQTINLIENLLKIKGYLNNCQAIIKVRE